MVGLSQGRIEGTFFASTSRLVFGLVLPLLLRLVRWPRRDSLVLKAERSTGPGHSRGAEVADGSLQAGPGGEKIARYLGGVWTAAGYDVPECIIHGSTCTARFEAEKADDSITHNPFHKVEFVDGSVCAQPGRRLLARFDEQEERRYSCEDKRSWPKLVVEKASQVV